MPPLLSKSSFMHSLECPLFLWLKTFHPSLLPPVDPATQRVFDQGNEVDALAKGLYPDGVEIEGFNQAGYENTKRVMATGARVLFQPTFVADGLTARGDILVKGKFDAWDIYEVKGSTQVKSEYYQDVAFQKICYTRAGIAIGRTNLVHINNKYVRKGAIDVNEIFISEDITDDVNDILPEISKLIPEALDILTWGKELSVEHLLKCPDLGKCEYVGYWLNTLEKKALEAMLGELPPKTVAKMIEREVFDVSRLSKPFLRSIPWKTPAERWPRYIDTLAIQEDLQQLRYPLFFFDYETIFPAIPPFDGCSPYQQIPFQFSLYKVAAVGAIPEQFDFLHDRFEDPRLSLIDALREAIGPSGSVISWNAAFEKGRNEEMAKAFPKHAEFLRGINKRTYDLMQIFRKKLYVDPGFSGSASLKKVMPALIPDLSYKNLAIQEGGEASASWEILTDPNLPEDRRHQLHHDMIEYCRLDVYGMVKILEHVQKVTR